MYSSGQCTNKKLIFAFLCLLTIFLSACDLFGGNNNHQAPGLVKAAAKYQVYIEPQIGISDISTLDPAQVNDPFSANAIQLIFTGLVQLDDRPQVRPQLAQSWDESPDALTWTFHLKTNLKFSVGEPFTFGNWANRCARPFQLGTRCKLVPSYLGPSRDRRNC